MQSSAIYTAARITAIALFGFAGLRLVWAMPAYSSYLNIFREFGVAALTVAASIALILLVRICERLDRHDEK